MASAITRTRILLKCGMKWDVPRLPENRKATLTIERTRKTFVLEVLTAADGSDSRASRQKYGEKEAHLIALACSQAPEGYARWSNAVSRENGTPFFKYFS